MKSHLTVAATAILFTVSLPALGQHAKIRSRHNLSVASTANMEKIKPKTGLTWTDSSFLKTAAYINQDEVEVGKLAERNGGVWGRKFGHDMVREHGLLLREELEIARKKGVSLPSGVDAKGRQLLAVLRPLHGAAFDAKYRSLMIKGHEGAVAKVQAEIRNGHDSKVRDYAVMIEPSIKQHLKMAVDKTSMMKR